MDDSTGPAGRHPVIEPPMLSAELEGRARWHLTLGDFVEWVTGAWSAGSAPGDWCQIGAQSPASRRSEVVVTGISSAAGKPSKRAPPAWSATAQGRP